MEALGNIVENAIKYTNFGGNVTMNVRKYLFFVQIDVEDNGIGIVKEEQNKIFSRFYRSLDVGKESGVESDSISQGKSYRSKRDI